LTGPTPFRGMPFAMPAPCDSTDSLLSDEPCGWSADTCLLICAGEPALRVSIWLPGSLVAADIAIPVLVPVEPGDWAPATRDMEPEAEMLRPRSPRVPGVGGGSGDVGGTPEPGTGGRSGESSILDDACRSAAPMPLPALTIGTGVCELVLPADGVGAGTAGAGLFAPELRAAAEAAAAATAVVGDTPRGFLADPPDWLVGTGGGSTGLDGMRLGDRTRTAVLAGCGDPDPPAPAPLAAAPVIAAAAEAPNGLGGDSTRFCAAGIAMPRWRMLPRDAWNVMRGSVRS
jgi:hypothetical protein